MTPRPLIPLAILAAGLALAAAIYTRGGDEQAPAAVAPAPVAIGAPGAAPRIAQPPLVSIPALPPRPRRAKHAAAPRAPRAPASARGRRKKPKPAPATRRSRLKQAPLEPSLVAPPD
jgi:hypothetical protein